MGTSTRKQCVSSHQKSTNHNHEDKNQNDQDRLFIGYLRHSKGLIRWVAFAAEDPSQLSREISDHHDLNTPQLSGAGAKEAQAHGDS